MQNERANFAKWQYVSRINCVHGLIHSEDHLGLELIALLCLWRHMSNCDGMYTSSDEILEESSRCSRVKLMQPVSNLCSCDPIHHEKQSKRIPAVALSAIKTYLEFTHLSVFPTSKMTFFLLLQVTLQRKEFLEEDEVRCKDAPQCHP